MSSQRATADAKFWKQKAAEQEQAQEQAPADAAAGDDDVVDAEFEEVDEDKKED